MNLHFQLNSRHQFNAFKTWVKQKASNTLHSKLHLLSIKHHQQVFTNLCSRHNRRTVSVSKKPTTQLSSIRHQTSFNGLACVHGKRKLTFSPLSPLSTTSPTSSFLSSIPNAVVCLRIRNTKNARPTMSFVLCWTCTTLFCPPTPLS